MKTILGILVILGGCCPKPGPTPVPTTDFKLEGKTVVLEGYLKPGSSIGVEEVKSKLGIAIELLDR